MPMANPFQTEWEHCQQKGCPNSEGVTCIFHWDYNAMNMHRPFPKRQGGDLLSTDPHETQKALIHHRRTAKHTN